jgi:phospholipid/cholesterol/gamma-HCH transport system substrate-binding protein
MDLDSRLKISTDTTASIVTAGILGDRYVSLQLGGDDKLLAEGDSITFTESAIILESLIGKFMYGRTGGGAGSGTDNGGGSAEKKGS